MTQIVCIGGSTGSIDVLRDILSDLPRGFGPTIAAVIHRHSASREVLLRMMHTSGHPAIVEPFDKQPLTGGGWYLAPPDYHLLIGAKQMHLSTDGDEQYSRPAIDPLFISAARAFGASTLAIVLSGANRDGAAGAAFVRSVGGNVIVQDPKTAMAPSMPEKALEHVPEAAVAKPEDIAGQILAHTFSKAA